MGTENKTGTELSAQMALNCLASHYRVGEYGLDLKLFVPSYPDLKELIIGGEITVREKATRQLVALFDSKRTQVEGRRPGFSLNVGWVDQGTGRPLAVHYFSSQGSVGQLKSVWIGPLENEYSFTSYGEPLLSVDREQLTPEETIRRNFPYGTRLVFNELEPGDLQVTFPYGRLPALLRARLVIVLKGNQVQIAEPELKEGEVPLFAQPLFSEALPFILSCRSV